MSLPKILASLNNELSLLEDEEERRAAVRNATREAIGTASRWHREKSPAALEDLEALVLAFAASQSYPEEMPDRWLELLEDAAAPYDGPHEEWGLPHPETRWMVEGWMPAAEVTLLGGQGGLGKSRLVLQIAGAMVKGERYPIKRADDCTSQIWLPAIATTVRDDCVVCYHSWEDDFAVTDKRLTEMDLHDNHKGRLIFSYEANIPLWAEDKNTMGPTPRLGRLLEDAAQLGCDLLIIDPLYRVFHGDENARREVGDFMGHLYGWVRQTGCTVLIVAHPSKSATQTAQYQPLSGSTAWSDAARAVWSFTHTRFQATDEDGKKVWYRAPTLRQEKNNRGELQKPLYLHGYPAWQATTKHAAAVQED